MGDVIYLSKKCPSAFDNNKNNVLPKLLVGFGGMLIIYGLYRLVRAFEGR